MTLFRRVLVLTWLPVAVILAWWLVSTTFSSIYFPPLPNILKRFADVWLFDGIVTDLMASYDAPYATPAPQAAQPAPQEKAL